MGSSRVWYSLPWCQAPPQQPGLLQTLLDQLILFHSFFQTPQEYLLGKHVHLSCSSQVLHKTHTGTEKLQGLWKKQQDGKGKPPSLLLNPIQARQQESRKEEEKLSSKSPCKLLHTKGTARRRLGKDAEECRKNNRKKS